jgi:amino acid transporter
MPANRLRRTMHPVVRHHATQPSKGPRILGAGSIALISLAAVLTLRGFPSVAEYGWSSIAFYVLGALFFLIPLALVAAELATGWPRAGGVYAWVKEAFGDHSGFVAVWFEWVEDVVWFPTVLSFVAATLAYAFDPSLANNKLYLVVIMLAVFWGLTLANFFGMKWTARLNNPGVPFGTLLPAIVLIALGAYWFLSGRTLAIPFKRASWYRIWAAPATGCSSRLSCWDLPASRWRVFTPRRRATQGATTRGRSSWRPL